MKKLFAAIGFLLLLAEASAQNIGFGTTTPVNQLSVNGKANITDSLGIGIAAPSSPLQLQSTNISDTSRGDIVLGRYWNNNSDTKASSIFHYNNTSSNSDNLAFGVSGNRGNVNSPNTIDQIKMLVQANGNVGIGTNNPAGKFHVKSAGVTSSIIDQQQMVGASSAGNQVNWQSFTAGVTGLLTKVALLIGAPRVQNFPEEGKIKIFSGEGNGGTLLSTTSVLFRAPANGFAEQTFILDNFVPVVAGNKYTIEFSLFFQSQFGWVKLSFANPYAGGRANSLPSVDYNFRTYVATEDDDALVVNGENVGIGTISPVNKLSVNGNADISGNVGIGVTTASNKLSVDGNSDITGNLAIGSTGTVATLDVNGGIRTKYSGSAIFDVIGGGVRTLSITMPAVPEDWNISNTVVIVRNEDGVDGIVRQARLSNTTTIDVKYYQDANGPIRLNWVIFKM